MGGNTMDLGCNFVNTSKGIDIFVKYLLYVPYSAASVMTDL